MAHSFILHTQALKRARNRKQPSRGLRAVCVWRPVWTQIRKNAGRWPMIQVQKCRPGSVEATAQSVKTTPAHHKVSSDCRLYVA